MLTLHQFRIGQPQDGFTTVELITVMVLSAILAAMALPKLMQAVDLRDDMWRDQVQAALRFAQKGAVARRRLTCVTISPTVVAITTASVNNGSGSVCNTAINGPDGNTAFATASNSNAGTSSAPSGVIYFQPDGTVTTDSAGTAPTTWTITLSGAPGITINGWTGYVQ